MSWDLRSPPLARPVAPAETGRARPSAPPQRRGAPRAHGSLAVRHDRCTMPRQSTATGSPPGTPGEPAPRLRAEASRFHSSSPVGAPFLGARNCRSSFLLLTDSLELLLKLTSVAGGVASGTPTPPAAGRFGRRCRAIPGRLASPRQDQRAVERPLGDFAEPATRRAARRHSRRARRSLGTPMTSG